MTQTFPSASQEPNRSILIVEDNPADAFLLKRYLEKVFDGDHIDFSVVPRLSEAIEVLRSKKEVELITLDLKLPDTVGLEAVAHLKTLAPAAALILVSGSEDPALGKKAVSLGAQDYLVKSRLENPKRLRWSIEASLERQKLFNKISELQKTESHRNNIKTKILSHTAHDIRSPLAGVIAFLEKVVEGDFIQPLSPEQKHIFNLMLKNCREVTQLANELTDCERNREKLFEVKRQKVKMAGFLEELRESLASLILEKNIELSVENPAEVDSWEFDPFLIKRALQNLLSNAIQHTHSGGSIQLKVEEIERRLIFSVINEGNPIDEDSIEEQILGIRPRQDSKNAKERVGLGLHIVDQVAKSHGGCVCGNNRSDGKGAIFLLRIDAPLPTS